VAVAARHLDQAELGRVAADRGLSDFVAGFMEILDQFLLAADRVAGHDFEKSPLAALLDVDCGAAVECH
jgi:hypothetical protein